MARVIALGRVAAIGRHKVVSATKDVAQAGDVRGIAPTIDSAAAPSYIATGKARTGRLLEPVPVVAAGFTLLMMAEVVIGWAFGRRPVSPTYSNLLQLVPLLVVCYTTLAVSLLLLRDPAAPRWRTLAGRSLAVAIALVGAAAFVERTTSLNFGIDLWFWYTTYPVPPSSGRPSIFSAVALGLLGSALGVIDVETKRRVRPAEALAVIAILLAFLAALGYVYAAWTMYTFTPHNSISLISTLSILSLSFGILAARADRGLTALLLSPSAGGLFVRRLLPATILIPAIMGWVWLEARDRQLFDVQSGIALFAVAVSCTLLVVVLRSAAEVRDADAARERLLELEHQARADAEAASNSKSQFLATVSHELRTPLNAITGYADLLLMDVPAGVTEEHRAYLERVKHSGRHLLLLINDILDFARIDSGQLELAREHVVLHSVLNAVETILSSQVADKGITFIIAPSDDAVYAEADYERVQQIVLNLLTNAIKFTDAPGRVEVRTRCEGNTVRVSVRDSGRGIPADQLERIFEPFVQVDRHLTTGNQQGVGLGLTISRDLARRMGGDLVVTSEVGVGSEFVLSLPRSTRA